MADVEKEMVTGVWSVTGNEVKFNRNWAGHRFTDDEVQKLLDGEEIEITGLKSKKGTEYGVYGKLSEQTYNGNEFIGFERLGFVGNNDIPNTWAKHKFTEDEKTRLRDGKKITVTDCVSKKGNDFSAEIMFGEKEDGSKGIIVTEWL